VATCVVAGPGGVVEAASPTHRIHQIQGDGASSPLANNTVVTIEGVVTGWDDEVGVSRSPFATFENSAGIFVQEEPEDADSNPQTSEGIFVGNIQNRALYPVGTRVQVTGRVRDGSSAPAFFQTMIERRASDPQPLVLGLATSAQMPVEVVIDTASATSQTTAKAYYESLEGMLVTLPLGVANSGGTNKFGELFLTPGTSFDPLLRTDAFAPALIGTTDDAGSQNPTNPLRPTQPNTAVVEADLGDEVRDVSGPLSFSFSNYKIAVQPGRRPTVTSMGRAWTPPVLQAGTRIASFNLENLFPVGGELDGALVTEAERDEKIARLSVAIGSLLSAPDIVAVQEVADLPTLQLLASSIGSAGYGTYTAYLVEGNDNRGIDVGYLVKSTVTVVSVEQLGLTATNPTTAVCSDVAGRLFDRPPLLLRGVTASGPITLINNHFSSKAAPDACRNAQASFVADAAASAESSGQRVIVLGDFNAFEDETPLAALQAGTLSNLWPQADGERYSFQFNGLLQTLDHIVIGDALDAAVVDMRYMHISNDFYDRGDSTDGRKVSDHDPPVLTLALGPDPVVPEYPIAVLPAVCAAGLLATVVLVRRRRVPQA
jgi:predicted extracellular nuclease